ncbi:MAG: T9SS type A sorting domain-containing protein [Bacteroidetes bacterium]|nr:T9SS type A sorting domain-containing protein [Bacteroidota bacterium]
MKKIYLLLFASMISAGVFAQFVPILVNPGTSGNIVVGQLQYHASESIYLDEEIGHNNYTTAASAIQQIFFISEQDGLNTSIANYRIYLKNIPAATTTLATGTYTTVGYTLVFNGTFTATPVGLQPIILTTPFVRTAGTNLQMLIVRTDNAVHTNSIYDASVGNVNDPNALTSRRYNSATAPVAGTSSLAATNFRPAIAFNHTFAIDAILNDIYLPTTSCFNAPQSVFVEILNGGTTDIPAGAAAATLRVSGANTFSGTLSNSAIIPSGGSEFIEFTGVSFNNPGINTDSAWVTLAGDGTSYYDTLVTGNQKAETLNTFPLVEDVETTLPVFPYAQAVVQTNIWGILNGDYTYDDGSVLPARAPGQFAYWFDSYDDPFIGGTESRLFSNCIDLTNATAGLLTFWLSHDTNFVSLDLRDSMYLSVSTDRGQTWNRIAGYARIDPASNVPAWRMESVNLTPYLGSVIQIGFEGVSQFGESILLDDITIAATLPVSIVSFNAQRAGNTNLLTWKTSQEQNSSKFVIERSTDGGRNFSDIGEVAAAGNSNTERNYRFVDKAPVKGINYYRLRMVDLNSTAKYSDIKNVRNLGAADFSIAPNPVQQQLKIRLDADNADRATIVITDMSGKQVYSNSSNVSEGSNDLFVNTGSLAHGTYIIRIQLSNDLIVKKFNKL